MYKYSHGRASAITRLFTGLLSVLTVISLGMSLIHFPTTHADSYASSNGVLTATASISGTGSNFSDASKLCSGAGWGNANKHADFVASLSNPSITLGATTSTLSYDLNLTWKACDGTDADTTADVVGGYAIYSTNFCALSGHYSDLKDDDPSDTHAAYDCLKYVGSSANPNNPSSPASADSYKAYLGCVPGEHNGHGDWCTTSLFNDANSGIQQVDDHPHSGGNSKVVHEKGISINNPARDTRSSGSKTYGGDSTVDNDYICEYYTYGGDTFSKQKNPTESRCILLSINISWTYSPNPTSVCTDSLAATDLWPGESTTLLYTVMTQNIVSPSGSITGYGASGGTLTMGGLSPSGTTLMGRATYTAPFAPGMYTITSGNFASNPDGLGRYYNSTCSPASITIMVGYMPYFKAYGGDVQVGYYPSPNATGCYEFGSGIDAWNMGNRGANNYAGAGSQFGVDALGVVTGFASGQPDNTRSGAAFTRANGPPLVSPSQDNYGGSSGDTSTRRCVDYTTGLTDVSGNLKSNGILTNLEPDTYTGAGVVPTGDIANHYTLYVKGNLYIDHDIKYSANSYTLNTIPSFKIVVTGNIYIAPNVAQLDGVYIAQPDSSGAGGNIYTCATGGGAVPPAPLPVNDGFMSYSLCGFQQLTVNGSFVAKKVYLLRTHGSLNDSIAANDKYGNGGMLPTSNAAEQFIYSPETWLGQASFGNPTPAAIISLPPVY